MRCESCHGAGHTLNIAPMHLPGMGMLQRLNLLATMTRITARHGLAMWQPCHECGGSGIAHCCDGMQAQPE